MANPTHLSFIFRVSSEGDFIMRPEIEHPARPMEGVCSGAAFLTIYRACSLKGEPCTNTNAIDEFSNDFLRLASRRTKFVV
jgi:hypothetical protein